jgi:plasminogen
MQNPHNHDYYPSDYEYDGLDDNYCRNPMGDRNTIWCYTTDYDMKWDFCYPVHETPEYEMPEETGAE